MEVEIIAILIATLCLMCHSWPVLCHVSPQIVSLGAHYTDGDGQVKRRRHYTTLVLI